MHEVELDFLHYLLLCFACHLIWRECRLKFALDVLRKFQDSSQEGLFPLVAKVAHESTNVVILLEIGFEDHIEVASEEHGAQ